MNLRIHRLAAPLLATLLFLPFIPMGLWTIANKWQFPNFWPQELGLRGWRLFIQNGGYSAIFNSFVIGALVVAVVVPLSFMAAAALSQAESIVTKILSGILFLPVFLPPFVLVMGVTTGSVEINLSAKVGVILTLSVLALPYSTFILRSALLNYGSRWEEEGKLLGAKNRHLIFMIRIPMLRNAILAAALVAFLIGWSDYIVTLTVGGGQVLTLPILIGSSVSAPGNDAALAAMSVASIGLPVLLIFVIRALTSKWKIGDAK